MEFIHSTDWMGSKPGLERITELMDRLGNPHKALKIIHVAGTNGKGSFCAMLDSVLRDAEYKTGLFTSPYIEHFEERICYCGEMIKRDELTEITELVSSACSEMKDHPTEFEIITAIGFEYFKRKQVDIAIIECGLGGRLDSTNISEDPILSVITGISLDHMAVLGETISEIAQEKAGIIKPKRPVLYGGDFGDAEAVIKSKASKLGCSYTKTDREAICLNKVSPLGCEFSYKQYPSVSLSLTGVYQPLNAANVIEAVCLLRGEGYKISDKSLYNGLLNAKWKGRFERLCDAPPVFFDGGHNLEGVLAAVKTVKSYFGSEKITVISGVMRDKDYLEIAKQISTVAKLVLTVTPNNTRALPAKEYADVFGKLGAFAVAADSFDSAIETALGQGTPVLCLGSLYSYSDFKEALNRKLRAK